jgi:O-antigen/teichoic acid export membrane protein
MGIESGAAVLTALLTSVAVARAFGPTKLGYFNFVLWLCGMSASLGSLGIPITTGKYMAEFLGRGDLGVARAVFFATLRAQAIIAMCIAGIGGTLVFTMSDPAYRWISSVIVAGIVPQMIAYIPSQANNAAERLRANVPGSVAGMGVYTAGVTLSLVLHWGLLGVAASIFLCHVTEMTLKLRSVLPWLLASPAAPLPGTLRGRMFTFSRKSFALMGLNLVVWDRSDLLLLKLLNGDIRQIAFFSLPFSLVEKALMAPQVLANSIGATLFAEYGRSQERMLRIAEQSMKYLLLGAVPLMFGMAALSKGVIGLFYGDQYAPAASVLTVMALMAVAKSTFLPVQSLHAATERLGTVVWAAGIGGLIDIMLDVVLVPRFGALGAAVANGLGQVYAATWLWHQASRTWQLKPDFKMLGKILACGAVMSAAVVPLAWFLKPLAAVPVGIAIGAITYLIMLRIMALLTVQDQARFLQVWPAAGRITPLQWLIRILVGNHQQSAVSVETEPEITPAKP